MTEDFSGRLLKSDWEVRPVSMEIGSDLIRRFHYAKGNANTRTYLHGLFKRGSFWDQECSGVAWWIPPTRSSAEATYPENWEGVLSLSRLVIVPNTPKNACTFLLSRSVRLIDRKRWPCLVTYADEWQGHTGTIYRAAGWKYVGKTNPEKCWTLDGEMKSRKAGQRTRTQAEMIALGARAQGSHSKHKFVLL